MQRRSDKDRNEDSNHRDGTDGRAAGGLRAGTGAPSKQHLPHRAPAGSTAATATVVEKEPSIEDGVIPRCGHEGEPEDPSGGRELTCADNPLATHFFTLVGGNTVDDCGRKDPKVLAAFNALMKNSRPNPLTKRFHRCANAC
jgi:hypothetical protein